MLHGVDIQVVQNDSEAPKFPSQKKSDGDMEDTVWLVPVTADYGRLHATLHRASGVSFNHLRRELVGVDSAIEKLALGFEASSVSCMRESILFHYYV
jgi:hypothetical protein